MIDNVATFIDKVATFIGKDTALPCPYYKIYILIFQKLLNLNISRERDRESIYYSTGQDMALPRPHSTNRWYDRDRFSIGSSTIGLAPKRSNIEAAGATMAIAIGEIDF